MATTYRTSEEAQKGILRELQAVQSQLRAAIQRGEIKGDINSIENSVYGPQIKRLESQLRSTGTLGEIGTGIVSSVMGTLTGLPDIARAGINLAGRTFGTGDVFTGPSLQERAMSAIGLAPEPTSSEAQVAYYAPDVAVGAYGIASLLKGGFKGAKSLLADRKTQRFLDTLPESEANVFSQFMMKGQGSDDPRVAAILQKLQRNPDYAELFTKLQEGATKAATAGVAPRASRLTPEVATEKAITGVEESVKAIKDARAEAGTKAFTKAAEAGGDRAIVNVDNTLEKIRELKGRFSKGATDSSKKAVQFLQSIEDQLVPKLTVQGRAGQTVQAARTDALGLPAMERDATGMLVPSRQVETIAMPGSAGYTVTQPARKLTVGEAQTLLQEFGVRAAKGESLVTDLALGDQKVISSAIFGGLKDDLRTSLTVADNVADKKALGYLVSARKQSKDAADAYNDMVSKGMPKMLQEKSLAEIEPQDLLGMYEKLTPNQRGLFRDYVGTGRQEALQYIDKAMFDKFITGAKGELADGTIGVDLGQLAKSWATMGANEKDILARSLGQNVNEFSSRMKDALVFTRKMDVLSPQEAKGILEAAGRDVAAVVGASPAGYSGAKATQLVIDAAKAVKNTKLSEEQLMKVLLTPEGANFLKSSALSPASKKALDALTAVQTVEKPTFTNPFFQAYVAGTVAPDSTEVPTAVAPEMPPVPDMGDGELPPIPQGVFEDQQDTGGLPPIPAGVFASNPAEQAMSQDISNINTQAPGMLTQNAVQGIQDALNSGQLQGPDAEEARRLLSGMNTGLFSR